MGTRSKSQSRMIGFILAAIFAAITSVMAQIVIPLGPIPLTLSLLGIYLAAGLLGPRYGTLSVIIYVLLGLIGLPVFAGFAGGVGILAGPTGGYIIGYIPAAYIIAAIAGETMHPRTLRLAIAIASGTLACYLIGTIWFIISTGTGVYAALGICVFPFLPGDALKLIAAIILIKTLKRHLPR